MAPEWYLPAGVSVVVMLLTGGCLYGFARLEMSRVNAYSLAVIGVAAEIVLMSLWVFAGPV